MKIESREQINVSTFFALSIRVVTVETVREAIITDDCLILIAITASLTAPDGIFTEWSLFGG